MPFTAHRSFVFVLLGGDFDYLGRGEQALLVVARLKFDGHFKRLIRAGSPAKHRLDHDMVLVNAVFTEDRILNDFAFGVLDLDLFQFRLGFDRNLGLDREQVLANDFAA